MKASEVRDKYINFFKSPPRNHKEISSAPLVPEGDPTTLFTSSGMQQLVPYLMGKEHPEGKRLVDSQPSIRTIDIDEVGNNRHLTFFEMLGNWSLGDYFKKEQLAWIWEFYTKELGLDKERLWVSVFEGYKNVAKDEVSEKAWLKVGVSQDRIFCYGVDKNWWSRSGLPDQMPVGEIGGPDSEVFYDFGEDLKIHEKSPFKNKKCDPNCECGRFMEIGNSVFIQYKKQKDGTLTELAQRNVDFGGGLERVVTAVANDPDIYNCDLFSKIIKDIEEISKRKYTESEELKRSFRIVADHLKASTMLVNEEVLPSNKLQGYVLRRLIRRSAFHLKLLGVSGSALFYKNITNSVQGIYGDFSWNKKVDISQVLIEESERFEKLLNSGLKKLERVIENERKIDGKFVFDLYQTEGFPQELTLEVLGKKGISFGKKELRLFEKEFKKHRRLSRTAGVGMFKGGLADKSIETTKLHTTAHLLQASLRRVLSESVEQKGQNITAERLRFDFSHPQKLTDGQLKKVENLMNVQIDNDLPVSYEVKTIEEAKKEEALAFFREKYGEKVNVYTIGDPNKGWFSKEVCGGPHVKRTSEIGRVKIRKQEKLGAGIVRIYVVLELDDNT